MAGRRACEAPKVVVRFNYLGYDIYYGYDKDIDNTVNKFRMICGTIHRTLKHKVRRTQSWNCISLLPKLLDCVDVKVTHWRGSEGKPFYWKLMVVVCWIDWGTWIYEEISWKSGTFAAWRMKCKQRVEGMSMVRIPKTALEYRHIGPRRSAS